MIQSARALLAVMAVVWLTACSGSESSTPPPSTTTQSPTSAQEPTKPTTTTQPPNMAPPSSQPPGSPPPGSQSGPSGSGGTLTKATGFNSHVRTIGMTQDGTNDLYVGGDSRRTMAPLPIISSVCTRMEPLHTPSARDSMSRCIFSGWSPKAVTRWLLAAASRSSMANRFPLSSV